MTFDIVLACALAFQLISKEESFSTSHIAKIYHPQGRSGKQPLGGVDLAPIFPGESNRHVHEQGDTELPEILRLCRSIESDDLVPRNRSLDETQRRR